jgi:AcrR family transcriptional regulator
MIVLFESQTAPACPGLSRTFILFSVADMPRIRAETRAARREHLLAAAARCVAREGFHKTTMAHVIAESGMSAGAVYGYFSGKHELIRAIADSVLGDMSDRLSALAEREPAVTPLEALEVALGRIDELLAADGDGGGDLPRVAVQAWAEAGRDERVAAIVRDRLTQLRAAWHEVLERAQQAGSLAGDADLDRTAQVLVGTMMGFLQQRLLAGGPAAGEYVAGLRHLRC